MNFNHLCLSNTAKVYNILDHPSYKDFGETNISMFCMQSFTRTFVDANIQL